jgi:hypothetical protein
MSQRKTFPVVAFLVLALEARVARAAGPYTDDLSKCLVRSTSAADKSVLVQWIFATMALHPDVKWLTSASGAQRADLNKKAGALFQRLLTGSCLSEARQALQFEGQSALEASFSVLGQVAARELFTNPEVAAGMAGFQ